MVRLRVDFAGRVQGVGFRATARMIASRYAVTGWVRNEPDGSVTMEVQGDADEVERCLASLRGRMAGLIRSERSTPGALIDGESGFTIDRHRGA